MTSCKKFPTAGAIYILEPGPRPLVHECNRNGAGDAYLCDGTVSDGFWKLARSGDKCRWMYCKTPFKINQDGSKDYTEYSDCRITNFPYYILEEGSGCSVHNIFTGDTAQDDCQTVGGNNKTCCTKGAVCASEDCLQYKALDKYLVSKELNYKCSVDETTGGPLPYCVESEPGKGDFTDPFCDYQCVGLAYPKNYTCVNGYCQKVADPDSYGNTVECQTDSDCGVSGTCDPDSKRCRIDFYDNEYCDAFCKISDDVSFTCNAQTKICDTLQDKSGEYLSNSDCTKACAAGAGFSGRGEGPAPQQTVSWVTLTLVLLIILANVLVIYAVVWLINQGLARKKAGRGGL